MNKCQAERNGESSGEEMHCVSLMTIFQITRLNVNSDNYECAVWGSGATSPQA